MRKSCLVALLICFVCASYSFAPGQEAHQPARAFDSFGDLTSDDTGARMDNFAVELQNRPEMDGYIICYGPEGEGSGTGKYIIQILKDYLVNVRAFEPERIKTIYGGRYKKPDDVLIELWVIPRGAPEPEPKHYKSKVATLTGKFSEFGSFDGFADGGADGPVLGDVTLATFADALRQQSKSLAHIVAFNKSGASPGAWRRAAKRLETSLQEYGVGADRINIIYGGVVKKKEEEGYGQETLVQLWILPSDAPPPVKEAKPERTPTEAALIGSYQNYYLKTPDNERWIFEGFADVLRANNELSVCLIYHPLIEVGPEEFRLPDEPPDIEPSKLIETWKSALAEKYGVRENRIIVLPAAPDESNNGMIEVWVVPPGAPLPDPYASGDEALDSDEPR